MIKKAICPIKNNTLYLTFTTLYTATASKPISYYYKILGIKPGFTPQQLKSAYLDMVKKYHPDLSKQPNAKQMFMQVQTAYDILQDKSNLEKQQKFEKNVRKQFKEQSEVDGEQSARKFHENFYEAYKRKQHADQSMQFSYNLYKKHYEQMQEKKKEYKKYHGQDKQIWAKKDQKHEPMWGTLGLGALIVALAGGAVFVVNLK